DLHALDGVDAHDSPGEAAIQLAVPVDEAANTGGETPGDDLDDTAKRVAGGLGVIDPLDHAGCGVVIVAADFGILRPLEEVVPGHLGHRRLDLADGDDVAGDLNAQLTEERLRNAGGSHARRGLPRAGSLEDEPHVVQLVLERAGQVSVAGSRNSNRRWRLTLP